MIFPIKNKKYHRRRIFFKLRTRRTPKIYAGSRRTSPSRSRSAFQKIIWQGLLGGLFIGIIWVVFFSPVLRIKEVNITGNEIVSQEEITQMLKPIFEKRFFLVLPGDNMIFFNEKEAEELLIEGNLFFEDIKIEKKIPNSVEIKVKEKKAKLVWCQIIQKDNSEDGASEDKNNISENNQCYWVDDRGVAYNQAPPLEDLKMSLDSQKKEHLLILKERNKELIEFIKLGDKVANSEFINFVLQIPEELSRATDLEAVCFETRGAASRELHITTDEGWKVYFNTSRNIKSQVNTLADVLRVEIKKKERKNLEYIDLRVEDWVYYK